jgi:hypothetical protein
MRQFALLRPMLLVLLPLVALGIVGWLSLDRDQAAVERQAREKTSAAATRWLRLVAEVPDGEPPPDEGDVLDVRWDSEGVLLQPSPAPEVPMPATWLEHLPGHVRDALESARSARFAGRWAEVEQAVGRFADATNRNCTPCSHGFDGKPLHRRGVPLLMPRRHGNWRGRPVARVGRWSPGFPWPR